MNQNRIIMNFSAPPAKDDLETIAAQIIETLPEELLEFCGEMAVKVEDFADDAIMAEAETDDPYEILALFRSGKEISPGVKKKIANDDDIFFLYRRPILDLWCETQEDLTALIREVMIEELGRSFEFSDDDIEEMTARHYQGMI